MSVINENALQNSFGMDDQTRKLERRKKIESVIKSKPNTLRIKVISMGDSEVGKSCIIKRYCEERV